MTRPQARAPARRPKKYGVLSEESVLQIFIQRPPRNPDGTFQPSAESSHKLAAVHRISERAIRELWNRKSWANITRPLWTEAEVAADLAASEPLKYTTLEMAKHRKVGRPKRSKDAIKQTQLTASPPSSPPDLSGLVSPGPCPLIDTADGRNAGDFSDPFQKDWENALECLDLGTMLHFSDLAEATLQDCDVSWLAAIQETNCFVSSQQTEMEEAPRHGEDLDCLVDWSCDHSENQVFWEGVL